MAVIIVFKPLSKTSLMRILYVYVCLTLQSGRLSQHHNITLVKGSEWLRVSFLRFVLLSFTCENAHVQHLKYFKCRINVDVFRCISLIYCNVSCCRFHVTACQLLLCAVADCTHMRGCCKSLWRSVLATKVKD